jgi:hypothetical protein
LLVPTSHLRGGDGREDHRRNRNGAEYLALATAVAHYPISRQWKGYWQRQRRAA